MRARPFMFGVLAMLLAGGFAGCLGPAPRAPLDPPRPPGGFSDTATIPGAYDVDGRFSRVLQPGTLGVLPDLVVDLPSAHDGAPIQVGVVRPDVPDGVRVPVLLHASPYFPRMVAGDLRSMTPDLPSAFLVDNFVPRGYAVVFVAVRGTGGSGGCWTWYGPAERADLAQALAWVLDQPWSRDAVGVLGRSFGSDPAWELAGLGHPAVRTLVPFESQPDAYGWVVRNGTVAHAAGGMATAFPPYAESLSAPHAATDPAALGPGWLAAAPRATGKACPDVASMQRDSALLLANPDRSASGFFRERDLRPAVLANYRGSVFLVHGFADSWAPPHLVEPFARDLEANGVPLKRLYGQWAHARADDPNHDADPTRWEGPAHVEPRHDLAEWLVRWFDHWLRDDASVDLGPRVQVADTAGGWRSERAWPPADAAPRTFALRADGGLGDATPDAAAVTVGTDARRAVLNLNGLAGREAPCAAGCATFRSEPFAEGLRFAGAPRLPLTVTAQGPGGYVTADLFAESTDGSRTRLSWGQMDLRYAAGGDEGSAVTAGTTLRARMELEPTDAVVAAGSRLVLVLSQGGYGDTLGTFYYRGSVPTYPVRVEVGGDASALRVLAFERDAAAFFQPPR